MFTQRKRRVDENEKSLSKKLNELPLKQEQTKLRKYFQPAAAAAI